MDQKTTKKLISELESGDEKLVMRALKRVPHEGSHEVITPMLHLFSQKNSAEVRILLEKILYNLKDPASLDPLISGLKDKKLKKIHTDILTFIWQSGLDASAHLTLLVDMALEGHYMCAVEALTIIESLEDLNDTDLSVSIQKLDKAIEVKSDKSALLANLRQLLLEKLLEK